MDFNSLNVKGALQAGVMQKVYEKTLSGAASSVTISGLDGDANVLHRLIVRKVAGANSSRIWLRFNNDSSASIYGFQAIRAANTTLSAYRYVDNALYSSGAFTASGSLCFYDYTFKTRSGSERLGSCKWVQGISGTAINSVGLDGCSYNKTDSTNLTSIVLGDVTNGLGDGTYILLLKQVETLSTANAYNSVSVPKGKFSGDCFATIYENTVSVAAQTVTISGLDGDTDVLYELEVAKISGATGSGINFLINNDSTSGNYGRQTLQGSDTTASGSQGTAPYIYGYAAVEDTGVKSYNKLLIYAKQGYVRTAIVETVHHISGTTVTRLNFHGWSYNVTNTNMTSLVLYDIVASGIGVGTFIRLKTLKRKV